MADLCAQCSFEHFGEDYSDFENAGGTKTLTQKELDDGYGWSVLCESCGPTIVNDDGECIGHCLMNHKSLPSDSR